MSIASPPSPLSIATSLGRNQPTNQATNMSVACIDKTHEQHIQSYIEENLHSEWLFLDMDIFRSLYLTCINMGVEEFYWHLKCSEGNLLRVKDENMHYLYHAMHAAVPFNQTKADEKLRLEKIAYNAYLEEMAERMREAMNKVEESSDESDFDESFM